ncbi:MAG: hypothetical protein ABII64_05440 [Elusimicrobiota bacterium]
MNRKDMKKILMILLVTSHWSLVTMFCGCSKNPVTQLIEPVTVNASPQWSGNWTLYDDELKTGGDVMMIGWGGNFTVDFNCRENPCEGVKCIKLDWNGGAVEISGGSTDLYTGFSLIVAKSYSDYLSASRDLSPGGYTKASFYARKGFMSSNAVLRIESPNGNSDSAAPNNVWEGALTENWKEYTLNITGSLSAARHFMNIVLKTSDAKKGSGATVYIDNIKLTK